MHTTLSPISRACDAVGSQADLARGTDSSPSLVYQWVSGRRPVPNEKCVEIERLCNGVVTVEELQPNEKWMRVKDKSWPHPKGRPVIDYAKT